jgi:putative sigma-54 modulation protein
VVITVTGRHMEVTPALKAFAEEKANKLTKYYDRIQEIEVIFDANKDSTSVEIIVNAEHKDVFIAREAQGDAYASIDLCGEQAGTPAHGAQEEASQPQAPGDVGERQARRVAHQAGSRTGP